MPLVMNVPHHGTDDIMRLQRCTMVCGETKSKFLVKEWLQKSAIVDYLPFFGGERDENEFFCVFFDVFFRVDTEFSSFWIDNNSTHAGIPTD